MTYNWPQSRWCISGALLELNSVEHTLSLELPEELYAALQKIAEQDGKTPEELASHWLAVAIRSLTSDPLDNLVGSMNSAIPDWGDRHDWYIGQAILESMQGDRQ
jgi:hypothetical protein